MSDTPRDKAKPQKSASDVSRPARWRSAWQEFKRSHPKWIARLPVGEAVYVLPEPIIRALASPRGGLRPLPGFLDERDAKAERAFEKICREFGKWVIGVCDDGPLQFPLLFESRNDQANRSHIPDREEEIVLFPHDEDDIIDVHQRALAYAGLLSFHKTYRLELEEMKQKWLALPAPKPAAGPWASMKMADNFRGTRTGQNYYQIYDTFRSRWHLATLVSWDVPWPMGSVDAISPNSNSTELDYYPPYLDTPRRSIREKETVANAMRDVLPKTSSDSISLWGKQDYVGAMAEMFPDRPQSPPMRVVRQGSGPNEYETSFRMWLVELTVRRHYGACRGLSVAMIRGFATHLSRSEDHAKRLRKTYAAFLTS